MPWTPADLGTILNGWFKADALALANNDPVTTWTGSALSRDLVQATAGFRPLFKTNIQNSLPGVLLDGIDDYMDGSYFASVPQPHEVYILCSSTNWQFMLMDSTVGNRNLIAGVFEGGDFDVNLFAGQTQTFQSNLSTVAPVMIRSRFDGASSKVWTNGVLRGTADPGSLILGGGPRFGASVVPSSFFTGYFFEIIHIAGTLTDTQDSDVGVYLRDKWAVTWGGPTFLSQFAEDHSPLFVDTLEDEN